MSDPISMTDASVNIYADSPAQVSLKFFLDGYDAMLVLRGDSGKKLIQILPAVLKQIEAAGGSPFIPRTVPQPQAGPTSNGQAAGGERICPTHGVPLKPSRFGGYFCPQPVGEGPDGKTKFCTYKED